MEPAPGEDASTLTAGHTEMPITEEGKIVGTFCYMSPEQAQGKPVDARSDIFSFGSVLFEMLTGRRAFGGDTGVATLAAILNQEPAFPGDTAGPLSKDLERVVARCLRKDPQRRWQTMADLRVALQDLKDGSDSGKLSAAATPAPVRAGSKWILSAAALALVLAAALVWWLPRKSAGPPVFETERLTFESGFAGIPAISAGWEAAGLFVEPGRSAQPLRAADRRAAVDPPDPTRRPPTGCRTSLPMVRRSCSAPSAMAADSM